MVSPASGTQNTEPPGSEPRSGALRRGRRSIVGQIYLVTTVTFQRRRVFADFRAARLVVREIMKADALGWTKTLAYVVMPDHLHWLMQLREGSLSAVVAQVKQKAAAAVNEHRATQGNPLWQKGFHDHAVRRSEDVNEIAWYIARNPVRAGLVAEEWGYPHWDVRLGQGQEP